MTPSAQLISITQPLHNRVVVTEFDEQYGFDREVEVLMPIHPHLDEPLDLIEFAGRWDYGEKSVSKMGDKDIIRRWIEAGEESMLEMVDATFLITCSRVVTHELVRHRIASYQQESQRFVAYEDEDPADIFIYPDLTRRSGNHVDLGRQIMKNLFEDSLKAYRMLRANGVSKQLARYVLPNATRTRIIAKANLREWRHILRLRLHTSAQPEMQEVMKMVHSQLQDEFGKVLFPDNIAEERASR